MKAIICDNCKEQTKRTVYCVDEITTVQCDKKIIRPLDFCSAQCIIEHYSKIAGKGKEK